MFEQPYHKIIAWQRADAFVQQVYRETISFPEEEKYGITSQLRRAASSGALNIVEGQARATRPDFVRFLIISRGSLAECAYLLELSFKFNYLSEEKYRILEQTRRDASYLLQRMIGALRQ